MPLYKDEKRNTWGCRTYITDSKGKRKQIQRTGFKTKVEARNAEIKLLEEANKTFDDITFQELYEVYIKHKKQNLKFQSIRTLESRFEKHILPYFKDYKISKINNSVYIEWKEQNALC